ncbi:carbohydrate sulfotransferase 15-like [Liolophura sinensis]|uniref:carbohydrate sulfotransferase 15-like n=1 Tax=Liolophura sinensis TaxID=3198878 RepID=UPI0031585593
MFNGQCKLFVFCGFLLLFVLFQGMVILKPASVPKPIRATYGAKITNLWKYYLTRTDFTFETTYVRTFEFGTTPASRSPGERLPDNNHQLSPERIIWNSPENVPSDAKNTSYRVHTERTYKETFVEVSSRNFTDILRKPPVAHLRNFKNPCWIERASEIRHSIMDGNFKGEIRCLPYFFVAGFPKCGTTDLYRRLALHPQIQPPCAKEPHWWTRRRYQKGRSLLTYLKCFQKAAERIAESNNYTIVVTEPRHKITMDCSASTLWDQTNWRFIPQNNLTYDEPTVTNIHSIHHLLPNAKMIVIMRNPTDRLYSDYLYFNSGLSASNFHKFVIRSIGILEDCFKKRTTRACLYDKQFQRTLQVRLYIGVYSVYIEDWFQLYPREQFLFLQSEDYGANVTKSILNVFRFLDLDSPEKSKLHSIEESPNANTRSKKNKNLGDMLPETRTMLEKFYSPWNKRLAKLLNDSLYLWT